MKDDANNCRFALGSIHKNSLYVFGLNPSTATDQKPDRTISKVQSICKHHGYDSFVMLNLYPQRTPYPDKLHKRVNKKLLAENIICIKNLITQTDSITIWAAWGNNIKIRPYFIKSLQTISQTLNAKTNWVKLGKLTKAGHPRHPSRAGYSLKFNGFQINDYIHKIH